MCRLVPTRCSLPQGACLQAKLTKQTPTLDPLHNCTGTQESMRDLEEMHLSENPCPRLWGWTRCFVCRQLTESAGEHFWGLSIRTASHKLQPQDTHFKSCPKQFDLCFKKGYQSKAMKEKKILGCNTGKTVKKSDLEASPTALICSMSLPRGTASFPHSSLLSHKACSGRDPDATCYQR